MNKMEKKITAPEGCEIEKVELIDGVAVVTFKERKLPQSWEEFCEMFPIKKGECYVSSASDLERMYEDKNRLVVTDKNLLPDRATADAVLALCQLIQLRNAYNEDWTPDWNTEDYKYTIEFRNGKINCNTRNYTASLPLYFKSKKLRDKFLCCYRQLIEKLKPLYCIKSDNK